MPTTASTITRSPVDAINGLSPGDRRSSTRTSSRSAGPEPQDPAGAGAAKGGARSYLKLSKRVSYPLESVIEFGAWRPARLDLRARGALKGGCDEPI